MSIYTEMDDLALAVTKMSCVRALAPDQSKDTKAAAQRVLAKVIAEEKRRRAINATIRSEGCRSPQRW